MHLKKVRKVDSSHTEDLSYYWGVVQNVFYIWCFQLSLQSTYNNLGAVLSRVGKAYSINS